MTGSCALLFVTYQISQEFDAILQDAVEKVFFQDLPKKVAVVAAKLACQLLVSDALFAVFRYFLWIIVYALYELGRNTVFAIQLLFLTVNSAVIGLLLLTQNTTFEGFIESHRYLAGFELGTLTTIGWYWQRYYYRSNRSTAVYDHEIGAMLIQLKS